MAERDFVYTGHAGRVIFGAGTTSRLPEEISRLDVRRVLVLSTAQQESAAQALATSLGPLSAGVFAGAVMHTPVEVSETAAALARSLKAEAVVAYGGGSTTGLGKAIALRTGLPQIVLPTTYAGSEMTPLLGETQGGVKRTQTTPKVLPEVVIYDIEHTLSLPPAASGTSGINAIAHAVEALYARETNPVISLMAVDGIAALVRALPVIMDAPTDRAARADALYGAWLCGICLGSVGMALHHKLCHTLGGSFDLPHAETHAIVLPQALAYNAPAIPEAMARLRPVLGADPARALFDLARRVGAPAGLSALGMPEEGIGRAVDLALSNPYWNPRALDREGLAALIARAHSGAPPETSVA